MSQQQQQSVLTSQLELTCQLENHQSIIKYVCLDQNCSLQRLICDKCLQFEIHKHHQKQLNLKEVGLHLDKQILQNQELEKYLESLSISIPELIQQLKQVIHQQNSIKFTLSPQNNQLLNKIVKFEKISNHIATTMKNISDTYVGQIKKLIEFVNAYQENSSNLQKIEDINNQIDKKQYESIGSNITNVESIRSIQEINKNIEFTQEGKLKIKLKFLAESLKIQEKYEESITNYNKALEFDQKNLICWRGIGDCLRLIQEFLEAIPYYDKALYFEKNDIPSLIGKGECLRMLLEYEESKKCYEKVVNIDEKNIVSRVGLGECLRHMGSFLEAIGQYDKALEMDQKNIISLYGKGYCLRNIYNYQQADDCYIKVLEINPNHRDSKKEHDLCLAELKKNKKLYQTQVDQNTDEKQENFIQIDILSNRGGEKVYHLSNCRVPNQESKNEFFKSFQQLPNNPTKIIKRSDSFDRKLVRDYCNREALKLYEQALEKDPKDIQSLNGKGNCLRLLLKFGESLQTLETALKLNRNSISLYGAGQIINIFIGECLRMLKQFKDAEEFYMESLTKAKEESQSQDPIIFMNLRGLGDILRAKGEFQKSINFYDQALALRITLYHYLEKLKVQEAQENMKIQLFIIRNHQKQIRMTQFHYLDQEKAYEFQRIIQKLRVIMKKHFRLIKIEWFVYQDQVNVQGSNYSQKKHQNQLIEYQNLTLLTKNAKILKVILSFDLLEICLKEIKILEEASNNQGKNQ
ncbi:unnamed protein product [Paramecium pentaurelia]|uniref:Tetratricopeptide repeat protein n=1 Tax=Paramecium pentaurelia TaxID=43138 RepID=A0A8S1VSH9_9CILI|nr:unnamed protein product [Paramecium pentaurelia]